MANEPKEIPQWVYGVIGVLILVCMLAALKDPGHHLPLTPGYGSPVPSATRTVTPHK